jgi:tetratricopeptide (TPR) repeat protein
MVTAADEIRQAQSALTGLTVDCLPGEDGERCTLARLAERLRGSPSRKGYDVLYLACHGVFAGGEPYLLLENGDGAAERVSGGELAELINGMRARPRLVVLASCESAGNGTGEALLALGPRLVQAGVPAVIGMQGPVRMDTAAAFTRVFFRELNRDGQIERAAAVARAEIKRQPDWWSPVLWQNLLSGRLWKARTPSKPVTVHAVVPHQIAAPRANFIGRGAELAELTRWVQAGERAINIHGIDGLGKTALALQFISQVQTRFPDGLLYIDMHGRGERPPVTPTEALAHIIQSYDPAGTLPRDQVRLEALYSKLMAGKRVLILLDNAHDEAQIEALVPPAEGSLVLITSWRGLGGVARLRLLPLGKLTQADAETLLLALAPQAQTHASQMVAICDFLPQAINAVAGLMRTHPTLSAEDILILLEDATSTLEQTGVDTTLKVSYGMLNERQKQAWRRLAVFAGDFDAQSAAWVLGLIDDSTRPESYRRSSIQAHLALSELHNFGLIELDRDRNRFSLLNLARSTAASLMHAEEQAAARMAHARCYLHILERSNEMYLQGNSQVTAGLALFDGEQREIRAGWAWVSGPGSSSPERLFLRARYPAAFIDLMPLRMTPNEALSWLENGLAAARSLGDTALEIVQLGGSGTMYFNLADYERAHASYQAELELSRKVNDCEGMVYALGNLGAVYRAQGKPQRAVRYFKTQLGLARRFGNRREEAAALGNLGRSHLNLKEIPEAIAFYEQDLAVTRAIGDRRGEAVALGGLGGAYRLQKDYPRARQLFEQDLAICREIGDRRGIAIASWLIGLTYQDEGDLPRAANWMQVMVDFERDIVGQDARKRAARVEALRSGGD